MRFLILLGLVASIQADPILRFTSNYGQITCKDQSVCDDDNTCCQLAGGLWGCCPYPKATCCSDLQHCCPSGTTCDMPESKCLKGDISFPWMEKTRSSPPGTLMCPDRRSYCPSQEFSCCKSSTGAYECCPQPKATCCSDGVHCCPEGYACNEQTSTCSRGDIHKFWYEKISAETLPSLFEAKDEDCPDGKSTCPSSSTCCALKDGYYGCCPLEGAVCCDDKKHCCPSGYTCGEGGTCVNGQNVLAFTELVTKEIEKVGNVNCPDGQSYCPPSSTCCKQPGGKYGCCPTEKAVCCNDGLHCCPEGYKCDIAHGTCENYTNSIAMLSHIQAKLGSVACPDGQSECPDGNTCCKLSSGQYGCCPLPSAVCCNDGLHCCPNGYTCGTGTCNKGDLTLPLVKKTEANQIGTNQNPVCPDGHSRCQDGYTCCKMSTGLWGCCPLPNAVCCEDGIHCCPKDNICDDATPGCIHGNIRTPWFEKVPAITLESVACPDGQSECPDGNTCCKLSSGQYGCCPLPNAVCCSDKLHCCPNGYTCSTTAGTCNKGDLTLPWVLKTEAKSLKLESVACPDGQSECPDGNTCCKLSSGQYGCCPLPNAVCCSDKLHCCPNGYTCSTTAGTCNKGDLTLPWVLKTEAKLLKLESVACPDGQSECPDGNTCCKLSSGQYGCCPLPNAVCCSDKLHCCPNGYTCSTTAGTCNKGDLTLPWVLKTKAKSLKLESVACPDGQSECPDGNTCCKLSSGQYGCCPLPNAVCCSDKLHCCPNGYTCSTTAGTCNKGDLTLPWVLKTEAKSFKLESVACPDGQSECPDGNTCCKLSSGQYGCCPLLNAVCCSDKLHCCPNGYTCSTTAGTCNKGDLTLPWVLKTEAKSLKLESVACPDGQSECPDGNTCCKLSSGQYGCCPLPNAVCCSDKLHCCPNGYTCSTTAGTCNKGDLTLPWVLKTEAKSLKLESVACPDGQSECPDGNTCCKLSSGQYGCCPLPNAVCCSDKLHCCPNGYTCSTTAGTCNKGDLTLPWVLKTEAKSLKLESVACPDGQSECPDGNTCCKLSSGQYGCCPLPNAVCCSDKLHCCPNGYTCSTTAGTCNKGDLTLPWVLKTEAKSLKLESVACPDGQSECPDGNTCCKLSSGQYGCCPLPNAVCCSDKLHCCPNGYTCSTTAGTCNKGDLTLPWVLKTEAKSLKLESVACPDGQSECPDGNTCCKLSSGQYGCCPLPNAVCCSDKLHCCPNGYTCSTTAGTCNKGDLTLPWVLKTEAKSLKLESVACPDGQSECPDGNTCCKLSSGQYGCCPLPNAVCCSDKLHCCPKGYTCSTTAGTCNKGDLTLPWVLKTEAKSLKLESVACPDGQSECPDGNTCCKLSSGQYGCCPLPNAVCCSDKLHCCPNGYTCSTTAGTCNKGDLTLPWVLKTEAKSLKLESVACPDGQSECPDGNTCCKLSSGQYGCCPLPNAVCCSDKLHCCPNGYTCSTTAGTCNKGDLALPWVLKTEAKSLKLESVACPDGQSECPDGNTCCKLSSGQYGCCPLPNAVCCSDKLHCCPNGYTCSTTAGTCNKGDLTLPWVLKTEAKSLKLESVACPDGQSECPDGNTCCKLSSGQYGCCPLPNAVCCSDKLHCCPNGYTCSTTAGTCNKGDLTLPWVLKTEAKSLKLESVACPDGQSECPDGNTCCKLSSGQYGCCPLPNAVCCSDKLHCCPNGYTCSTTAGTCNKGDLTLPWVLKTEAKSLKLESVACPDGQSECPDGNTCCKLSSGQYGCCPLPNAVCCSDKLHCCPNGYTCSTTAGTCNKGDLTLPWVLKTEAKSLKLESVACPDGQSECPDGNTCCKLSSGQYGCCPLPNAVCCSDKLHCCPNGYTCSTTAGTCNKGDLTLPWVLKTEAKSLKLESVACPDGQSECPDGNTCCKLSSGQYGCCPLPNAVCCSDKLHCCPNGYTCSTTAGTCNKGDLTLPWVLKTEAKSLKLESVACPDGQSECPDGNTCCKLSSGQYGCCPLPNAVCCSDKLHCCPNGYTCSTTAGTCNKGDLTLPWVLKTEAKSVKLESVACPDGQSECPDGNTCCKLSSGQYGCCPLPNAVCCKDGLHCCPNGYTCSTTAGTCNKGDLTLPWVLKTEAKSLKLESVECPDGQSECPDGHTCCILTTGQYGCCPLPNAACCTDGIHCCPSGYTCDIITGTCMKGAISVPWVAKQPAIVRSVVCPGGRAECNDGNTCCKLASGEYGCCPLPKAVCCDDMLHCCPEGQTCDTKQGKCLSGDLSEPWRTKTASRPIADNSLAIVCPDGRSQCPNGNTCCKSKVGSWLCCPLSKAVCCSDGENCCPSGYTCNVQQGTCIKESDTLMFISLIRT